MIKVVAGIIIQKNKVLIAQRAIGKSFELKWEFPGGKIEENETPQQCLKRELNEELGITVEVKSFVCKSKYDCEAISVEIDAFEVEYISGSIQLSDHKQIKWVNVLELNDFDIVPADLAIARKLQENFVSTL